MMKRIADGAYQLALMPRNSINCYLIEGFLIDAGIRSSFGTILKHVKDEKLHAHVLTHAHPDHQGSTKNLCRQLGLPLYCHPNEREAAESGLVVTEYPSQNHIIAKFQQRFWAGEGWKVDKTLKEGDVIGNLRVIETPGHSSGHISFFREKDGLLIVGDAATNMNLLTTIPGLHPPPAIFTKDRAQNLSSLKKLASLKPQILCFGHGPVLFNRKGEFERFVDRLNIS